jgi:hypothetical protein
MVPPARPVKRRIGTRPVRLDLGTMGISHCATRRFGLVPVETTLPTGEVVRIGNAVRSSRPSPQREISDSYWHRGPAPTCPRRSGGGSRITTHHQPSKTTIKQSNNQDSKGSLPGSLSRSLFRSPLTDPSASMRPHVFDPGPPRLGVATRSVRRDAHSIRWLPAYEVDELHVDTGLD